MIIDIDFESVNRHTPPLGGTYGGTLKVFAGAGLRANIFEYVHKASGEPVLCDLLVQDDKGRQWVRDFMLMPDRTWRDSDGTRSAQLWALMPEEILDLPQVHVEDLPEFEVTP